MIKNAVGQTVCFQAISTTTGAAVTSGTPTVYVTIDGGTQGAGTGASTHEGNGCWSYACAQADTNGTHVAFTFVLTGAVSQTVNVYPTISSSGSGANSVTITWTSGASPVADGDVWITSDEAGNNVVAGTLQTNSNGKATFLLDAGSTYWLFASKDGVNAIRGQSFVAVAD
jgi:hypothetical protein